MSGVAYLDPVQLERRANQPAKLDVIVYDEHLTVRVHLAPFRFANVN
jgi:hypothetical protein